MRALVAILLVASAAADNFYRLSSPYSYACIDSLCIRKERSQTSEYQSQGACQLTCGQYGAMWPKPTGSVQLSKRVVHFSPENMQVTKVVTPDQDLSIMLDEATRYFRRNVHFLHPDYPKSKKTPYTEDEKLKVPRENVFGFNQRRTPFFRDAQQQQQQQQQQTKHESAVPHAQTVENWERYSPFFKEKYSRGIERQHVNIEITVNTPDRKLTLETDETYKLAVKTVGDETTVQIEAKTYYGARHALETLSQLIAIDDNNNALMIVTDATVQDAPQFKYRGFMLDTSRNYYPKEDLMRLIDAMSQNKMNYFQWHITDSASFPMYTNRRPEMAYYGAYSTRKVYYPEDIREVVQYAKFRGINVVPELNGPGHSAAGWEWGEKSGKGKLVLCTGEQQPWYELSKEPPSGQLNPVNPEVYNVLSDIYKDMMENFDSDMVHMGGDDVSFKCWQNSNDIKEYLAANNREATSRELFELWNVYQSNALSKLQESVEQGRQVTPIIHSSSFVRNYIDKNAYIVQINEFSDNPEIAEYVNNGYKVIFSNLDQWRLDCAGSSWLGEKSKSCPAEIPTWEHFYRNSPLDILTSMGVANTRTAQPNQQQKQMRENILGGSASLFSSETDANSFQAKTWPRVSAMAERLWSDPTVPLQGTDTTQKRFNNHRQRMVSRGVRADPGQPEYCWHNEGACYSKEQYAARSANIPQQQQQQQTA